MRSQRIVTALLLLALLGLSLTLAGGAITQAANPGAGSGPTAQPRPETLVIHLYFHDTAERDRLATEWNAEEAATSGGYLTVLTDRAGYTRMLNTGLQAVMDVESTQQLNNPNLFGGSSAPNTFDGGYKTVEEEGALLDTYAANYPTLAEKIDLGPGWCVTHGGCTISNPSLSWPGYDLQALHITNRNIPGPKPVYWYEAGIHAREIAVPEVAMRYIQWLLDNYNSDPDAHWLVDYHDIWVLPMVNPDGHHMVEYGGNNPILQRKNANYTNGCTIWGSGSSQLGTDNNRNFPFLWNCCGGSSSSACDQTYHGPSSGSDPETQAVVNKIRLLIPDQRGPNITDPAPITTTGVYQSMHSNASLNLFPWGFQVTPHAPNDAELRNIGHHMQAGNAYPSGNGYTTGQPPEVLYAVDGDTADWGYGELGAAAYTTEVGGANFTPPYSQIDSSIWPLNRGALIYQGKIARTPYLLAHGPDAAGVATLPMTVTQGTPAVISGTINFAWSSNAFSQNVGAAEYYVDTPPWAGGTAIPMTGNFGVSPTTLASANIDTSSLSVGRHLIFVRGRGVNQYSGYDTWGPISAAWLWVTPGGGATPTPTPPATNTPVLPTATRTPLAPTATPVPPSATRTPLPASSTPAPTNTSGPPLPTNTTGPSATQTPVPPTSTPLLVSATSVPASSTPVPGTATSGPAASATPVPGTPTLAAATHTPGPSPTPCTVSFGDVHPTDYFYVPVQYLACHGVISGYADGSFRPYNTTTRGQMVKIVVLGFNKPLVTPASGGHTFTDVPPGAPFFAVIETAAADNIISGYTCGGPGEPCDLLARPYFRPNAYVTRAELAKIVVVGAGWTLQHPSIATFADVPASDLFYPYVETAYCHGVISGYNCGGPGEPCDSQNRPYFRPNQNATRGQIAKIVYIAVTGPNTCPTVK